ncbi:CO(2)-response secreted protease-like [Euphorbia lathyris]|uniref:CO(2)-response secreted protease-like n=1 Tax=Euphorbia lathyris TaxID=212925 RepID=UPI0033132458
MKIITLILLLFPLFFLIGIREAAAAAAEKDKVFIVYLGAKNDWLDNDYVHLLTSVSKRKNKSLVRSYRHGFSGFAARLTEEEAESISRKPGVVSVFPDPVFQLHTTHSWDFLKYQTDVKIDSYDPISSISSGSDAIVGIIDTGIWPESQSFHDKNMGTIPTQWKGTCVKGYDFSPSSCNRKLIGARFYDGPDDDDDEIYQTPRDMIGHGSHVASTAAGCLVSNASYYGLAEGTARGGSPGSRIAAYRVCSVNGCRGSSILAAFDDAIADGVDILSLSMGSPAAYMPELKNDPIAIGSFHAVENGITVVCSAGNDGPSSGTVVNSAPWILTVAATTIDRDFQSNVILGGNKVIKGEGINFAKIGENPVHPLIYAKSARRAGASENEARNCISDSMEKDMIKGKIVVCDNDNESDSPTQKKQEVQILEGVGMILVDDITKGVASVYKEFPMTVISSKDAAQILSYINSTRNPVATILPTVAVTNYKPAPTVAYFSSRGPSTLSRNILKPDIAAPGVDMLAAWKGNDTDEAPKGKQPPRFNVISGTSMSCPHVSGLAAEVKLHNPTWGPSAIKSAIMTTASQTNNVKEAITTDSGAKATAYDYGAGEISTAAPLQAGLVYDTNTTDYINFLCYYGYDTSQIKIISTNLPNNFSCPKDSTSDLISNINYPSIAISNLSLNQSKNITRMLTNVGGDGNFTYTASTFVPPGLEVGITPTKLQFMRNGQRISYQVYFKAISPVKDVFGEIMWTNGKYKVRTPFVVSNQSSRK